MKNHRLLFLALTPLIGVGALRAADSKKSPDPVVIFRKACANPAKAYLGHMMITQWQGTEAKAEEANVYFKPPNRYRLEFLLPDGNIDRIVLTNGSSETVQFVQNGRVVKQYETKVLPRVMTAQQERDMIFNNYKVSLLGSEPVLGKPTWILELAPAVSGKPSQQVRVEQNTNVILESKRFSSAGTTVSMTRFTRFESTNTLSDSLFLVPGGAALLEEQTVDSPLVSLDSLRATMNMTGEMQAALPGGFSLLNADLIDIQGHSVRQFRYTDGLVPISLFETSLPVKMSASSAAQTSAPGLPPLGSSPTGQVRLWNEGNRHFTLIGDLDQTLLQEISSSIK